MAWYGANRNMGFKAPRGGFVDPDGVKYSIVDFSASRSSYVSETEQVFQYKSAPTNILQKYYDKLNPAKLGLQNGHGRSEGFEFGPWSSAHDEKADEFSTKAQVGHQSWNPAYEHEPKRGDQSPPRALVGHQYRSTIDDHRRKKGDGFSPRAQVGHQPWTHDHDLHDHGAKKGDGFSPKARGQDGYNSPRGNYEPMRGSPRSRDHYDSPHRDHGKSNNLSDESDDDNYGHVSDDDDVVCEDGVCYRKGSKSKLDNKPLMRRDYNQDKERTKLGHSYPKDNNDPQLHKGYNTPPYKLPLITTSPRDDRRRYEQSNNTHHPPPIKTRIGPHKGTDLQKDHSPRDSPRFGATHQPQYGSPRKEHQGRMETKDSGEARGKYGTTLPHGGVYVQEKYARTIDSAAAARKYNGVILPN